MHVIMTHLEIENTYSVFQVKITGEIYQRLIDAIKSGHLPSYFVPGQNIYTTPEDERVMISDQLESFHAKAQLALCRHIYSVLSD